MFFQEAKTGKDKKDSCFMRHPAKFQITTSPLAISTFNLINDYLDAESACAISVMLSTNDHVVCEEVKEDEMSKECSFDGEHVQVPLCLYCCLRSMQLMC